MNKQQTYLARNIIFLRTIYEIEAVELANRVGYKESKISRRSNPNKESESRYTLTELNRFASIFSVTLDTLINVDLTQRAIESLQREELLKKRE